MPQQIEIETIEEIDNPSFILIEGKNPSTGYTYDFSFIFEHPDGPYIKIDSERRGDFLAKGTEQQAQDALIELAQQIRQQSGGVFSIHPFHGAVWGTKLTPVAPGFLTDFKQLDEGLTMFVHLSDAGDRFDSRLTETALEIGTVVSIPSPQSDQLLTYMQTPKVNPNQTDRDQAIANGLGERWDAEFTRYHQAGDVPPAMSLDATNIVKLMRELEENTAITDLTVVDYN